MNIMVIGLGSMGKRRIRLIHELYPEYLIYGIDEREDRRKKAKDELGIQCYKSLSDLTQQIDCAFVCTSPLSHAAIISECLGRKWHTFTELNLVPDRYEENMALAEKNKCNLFLSSTFFYREEIQYIRTRVDICKKWNYLYHVGQYLPDWHPWENYRDFFIGNMRTNGCREILAIELPWLTNVFGSVKEVSAWSNKITNLDIGFNDNFIIQLIHENECKGVLIADVVSPYAVRKFEAYTEGSSIHWNGTPDSLTEFDSGTKSLQPVFLSEKTEHRHEYASFIIENAYKNEIQEFFEVVLKGKKPLYGFEQDLNVLKLIDKIGA